MSNWRKWRPYANDGYTYQQYVAMLVLYSVWMAGECLPMAISAAQLSVGLKGYYTHADRCTQADIQATG